MDKYTVVGVVEVVNYEKNSQVRDPSLVAPKHGHHCVLGNKTSSNGAGSRDKMYDEVVIFRFGQAKPWLLIEYY